MPQTLRIGKKKADQQFIESSLRLGKLLRLLLRHWHRFPMKSSKFQGRTRERKTIKQPWKSWIYSHLMMKKKILMMIMILHWSSSVLLCQKKVLLTKKKVDVEIEQSSNDSQEQWEEKDDVEKEETSNDSQEQWDEDVLGEEGREWQFASTQDDTQWVGRPTKWN